MGKYSSVQQSLLVAQLQGPCWGPPTFCGVKVWMSVLSSGEWWSCLPSILTILLPLSFFQG